MARRSNEREAETFEIVERIVERVDFQFAAVARAGIDFADRQASTETLRGRRMNPLDQLFNSRIISRGSSLRQWTSHDPLEQKPAHQRSCPNTSN